MIRFHKSLADLMVPSGVVTPHPDNDNNGDVDELVTSILVNGCYRPIYAHEKTSYILAGHTLYAALLELGALMVPVLWVDDDGTPNNGERILLTDNQIARLARRDDAATLQLLERLNEEENGLLGSGFGDRDIENLRSIADYNMGTPLKFDMKGSESLTHRITCPRCEYEWVRGHEQEEEDHD
jgi:ParB-like chromosome segregation protein Spo0J